jgi:hemolysin III
VIWNYDRIELITDGIVHVAGLALALVGATALVLMSQPLGTDLRSASVVIYGAGLVTMVGFSAAYNLWPISPRKWWLRRFDHSAIFIFIASTYTPLIARMNLDNATLGLLAGVWVVAALGVILKVSLPGRFDRFSIGLCLLLGSSGMLIYDSAIVALPSSALWLIAMGGVLYSTGVIFHVWQTLRFQNFIWHTFVLLAAICHYTAIFNCVVLKTT